MSTPPIQPLPVPNTGSTLDPSQVMPTGTTEYAPVQAASDAVTKAVNTPAPVPPTVRHARLMNMIQGLAVGLSAAGTSIGTGGKEGGAREVADIQAQQQQQKLAQQQQAQAARNSDIQQKIQAFSVAQQQFDNHMNLLTLGDKMTQEHLKTLEDTQTIADKVQNSQIQLAEFAKQNFGFTPQEITGAQSGQPGAAVDPTHLKNAQGMLSRTVGDPNDPKTTGALAILGADNPAVKTALAAAQDPNASVQSILAARQGLDVALQQNAQVQEAKIQKNNAEAGSPIAKLSTPEALSAPGAQAAIQAKIDDPATAPNDVARLRALLPQAAVAQFNAENIKQREARNTQIISQGDPDQAGKLLANRSLTLDELKSRQVTPQFIASAIQAAQKYDPSFKAAESAGQASIAKAPANQQFFGNTDSLLVRGGTLDQLATAGGNLGNTKIPVLNTLDNWRKAALGQGPQAAYAAAALGVADDYSKVMTGGQGSDTSRLQALNIINKNLSPEGRAAAIAQIRQAVESQRQGRIGTNPYLRDMYPDPAATRTSASLPAGVPPGSIQMAVPGGQPHWISPDKVAEAKRRGAQQVQ